MKGRELENLVAEVLREAGVKVMTQSPRPHHGADTAVWSDTLQPLAGNSLLVEMMSRIQNKAQLMEAANQVER